MNGARQILLLIFVAIAVFSNAQEKDPNRIIESIIESHLDKIDEQTDVALIIEDLEGFAEKPININATTASELSRLYILNDVQINKLLEYLSNFGPAYSIFELKTIDGFTPNLLQKIEPFIWFGPREEKQKFGDAFQYGKNQVLLRTLGNVQVARGYKPNDDGVKPYEGNQYKYYTRYKYEAKDQFSAGFTAEKDQGESFFAGSNKQGFDFYSAHASVRINSTFEQVTVGDFLVRSGQGLVLWQGYTTGKSENILAISKTNQGIRPSTAVDENLFFRGVATTLNFGKAKLKIFYSQKNDDGNIVGNDSTGNFVTSLQTSGYHRTNSEIEDKNSVRNKNFGGIVSWNFSNLKIGATLIKQQLNMPLIPASQLYNQFRFSGTENLAGGVDYTFNRGKYQLFGEAAMSKSKGKAFVQGAIVNLNDQLSFSLLYRHFDKNYQSLWANTFAEGSNISNESGLYFGTKILPVKYVTLSAYSDLYKSPWINYSTAAPSTGWDALLQANVVLSRKTDFYIRYKNEEKEVKFIQDERYVNLPEQVQKLRLHFNYRYSETIVLKTRIEHALYNGLEKETGLMLFQDIQFSPIKNPLNISARIAWFDTDSYNSRIYAYENDLLYTFSIPAFYGNGFRTYLNLGYKISKNIDCWFKIANTSWNDRDVISSGYNEISGNNKTELKLQLRLKI
ncbi:helix-hairpin-helix domain-containing protein [Draconibacterium sp.]